VRVENFSSKLVMAIMILFFLVYTTSIAYSAQRLSVKSKIANIRSGPGTNYKVLWQVERYTPIKVINKSGKWYKFKDFEGDTGWIYKKLVGNISTVITTKTNCNVRSGPSTKNTIVFTAEKGIPFKVIKRKGNWIKVKHSDGDTGWIYKSLVW
jgi:SH3-like domain-containing protein